ncbi:UTP--glucose-1-phosphate uridylyltransferase [Isosphaeraceae bacterium EP7]
MPVDPTLAARLAKNGQSHLLRWWDELDGPARDSLTAELEAIDFDRLTTLVDELVLHEPETSPASDRIEPIQVSRLPRTDGERVSRRHIAEVGSTALANGEVAVVVVAGGSGTRLGFEGPKGTYPIGPVSQASLFQIHAEKVAALSRRYGRVVPLYVMTSPENNAATVAFFAERKDFGLQHVRFFVQGQMPAVDRATGKVLLAEKGHLALSPDGHGGTLAALAAQGAGGSPSCLDEMRTMGVRTLFYFQVDNPLVKIADPAFVGLHRSANAEMSFKVVEKQAPDEKLGVVVSVDGKPQVIEYSDLPDELAERRDPDGGLQLWAGSIAVHILERSFVERLVNGLHLPYHRAIKKVGFIDDAGNQVKPDLPNAVKFETFIFDALPLAARFAIVETDRAVEFEPLKNATGTESPTTVRQRMSDLFAAWLEAAGAHVSRRPDGSAAFPIEISPNFALDSAELKAKLAHGLIVDAPLYLK